MRFILMLCSVLLALCLPVVALAQDTPDATVLVNTLLSAIQLKAWGVVVGASLLILVYAAKYVRSIAELWGKIPAKWRPVVIAALGVIASVGNALTHRAQWLPILITDALVNLLPVLLAIVSPVAHLDREPVFAASEAPTKKDPLP
jgi:ABC-type uncharacterized transport system permease subunit